MPFFPLLVSSEFGTQQTCESSEQPKRRLLFGFPSSLEMSRNVGTPLTNLSFYLHMLSLSNLLFISKIPMPCQPWLQASLMNTTMFARFPYYQMDSLAAACSSKTHGVCEDFKGMRVSGSTSQKLLVTSGSIEDKKNRFPMFLFSKGLLTLHRLFV